MPPPVHIELANIWHVFTLSGTASGILAVKKDQMSRIREGRSHESECPALYPGLLDCGFCFLGIPHQCQTTLKDMKAISRPLMLVRQHLKIFLSCKISRFKRMAFYHVNYYKVPFMRHWDTLSPIQKNMLSLFYILR